MIRKLKIFYQNFPEKVLYAKLFKLSDKGYLEYGTTIRHPWLTDKGKEGLLNG